MLLLLPLLGACSFDYRDSRLSDSLADEVPNSVLTGYVHTQVERGTPSVRASAERSSVFRSSHRAVMEDVRFREFDADGEAVTEGTADHATVFTRNDNVELSGSIRFTHIPDDFSVDATYLYWNDEERTLEGRPGETVQVRRGDGSVITGTGFSSSGIYRRVQFDGPVEGTYVAEEDSGEDTEQHTARETPGENGTGENAGTNGERSEGPKRFSFSGDSTSIEMAEGRRRTILSGSARISSEDTTITADRIELYGDEFRFARCSGDVKTEESEKGIHLSSRNLFYDREEELLRVEGYNEMVDMTNELVAKSGYLEHRGNEDVTVFQIGVRILKATEDTRMVCRSEFARYERESDQLTLSGMPEVHWDDDEYRATRIIINLESEEIRLEGDVEGTVTPEEENQEEENREEGTDE